MKTFVRFLAIILFTMGLATQGIAQNGPYKQLTQSQIDQLTPEQVQYLQENEIEVRVINAAGTQTGEVYRFSANQIAIEKDGHVQQVSSLEKATEMHAQEAREAERQGAIYDFESTGSEAGDIAKKQQLMEEYGEATPQMQEGASSHVNSSTPNEKKAVRKITQEQLRNMSRDELQYYEEHPEEYQLIDSNK